MNDILTEFNTFAYVASNVLVGYIAFALMVFVVGYYVLFDPKATTAGKMIFRFFLSLVGVIGLVFIATFIDPSADRNWMMLPTDVESWRPLLRLVVYGYVAFTITSLAVLLALRKWRPHRLKAAPDINLVKVRSITGPNPIVRAAKNLKK